MYIVLAHASYLFEKSTNFNQRNQRPFLSNHGAQVAPRASAAASKKWNTGTIDVYSRYARGLEDIEADLNSVERDVKGTRTLNKELLKEKLR